MLRTTLGSTWRGRIWALVCARDEQDWNNRQTHTHHVHEHDIGRCNERKRGPHKPGSYFYFEVIASVSWEDLGDGKYLVGKSGGSSAVPQRALVENVLLAETMHSPPCVSFSPSFLLCLVSC